MINLTGAQATSFQSQTFKNWAVLSSSYSKLLHIFDIINSTNAEVYELCSNHWGVRCQPRQDLQAGPKPLSLTKQRKCEEPDIDGDTQSTVIHLRLCENWSLNSIWAKFKITRENLSQLFRWIDYYETLKKNEARRLAAGKRRKLKEEHKGHLEDIMDEKLGSHITLQSLKNDIISAYSDLGTVSRSTIRRSITKDLSYRYKKAVSRPKVKFTHYKIRSYFESASLLWKLDQNQIEVIFIDEFSINTRSFQFYGWAKRGKKPYLKRTDSGFMMSFIVAVSKIRIYGIQERQEPRQVILLLSLPKNSEPRETEMSYCKTNLLFYAGIMRPFTLRTECRGSS